MSILVAIAIVGVVSAGRKKKGKKKVRKANSEGEYTFEWVHYKPTVIKENIPKQGLEAVVTYTYNEKQETSDDILKFVNKNEFEYFTETIDDAAELLKEDPNGPCAHHYVRDCNAKCAPAYWIGNGVCDDGDKADARLAKGRGSYSFDCARFWRDGGDCPGELQSKTNAILGVARNEYNDFRARARVTSMRNSYNSPQGYQGLNPGVLKRALAVVKTDYVSVPVVAVAAMAVVAVAAVAMKFKN